MRALNLAPLIAFLCVIPTGARADDAGNVLASCGKAVAGARDGAEVTFQRRDGVWFVSGVRGSVGASGVDVAPLARLPALQSLDLSALTATGLGALSQLPNLVRLATPGNLAEADLEAISHLPKLEDLDLSSSHAVARRDLGVLRNLRTIRRLSLAGASEDDLSLGHLAALGSLEELNLAGNGRITDAGLARLRPLANLQVVNLTAPSRITDAGIAELAALPALRSLSVDRLGLSGISALTRSPHLDRLSLESCETKPGMAGLSALRGLKSLSVWEQRTPLSLPGGLRELVIDDTELGNLEFGACGHLESLEIYLNESPKRRDWKWLHDLPGLTSVTLHRPVDEDAAALSQLASLRILRLLDIAHPHSLGDDGMAVVGRMKHLESLSIQSSSLTDRGMAELRNLGNLTRLEMNLECHVSDTGLANVWSLRNLRSLRLNVYPEKPIDGMLAELRAMEGLEELWIPGSVTDQGLMQLSGLAKLRRLDLSPNNGYTDEGLAALMQASPSLEVVIRYYVPSRDPAPDPQSRDGKDGENADAIVLRILHLGSQLRADEVAKVWADARKETNDTAKQREYVRGRFEKLIAKHTADGTLPKAKPAPPEPK